MRRFVLVAAAISALVACNSKTPDGAGGSGGSGGGGVQMALPGLAGPVDLAIDEHGIPHIRCGVETDCLEAQGYLHAQNRFWEMDVFRRIARGRLQTLLGGLLPADTADSLQVLRAFLSTQTGEPIEDAILDAADADTKASLAAYTAGVNAWLADVRAGRNGTRLPDEYSIPGTKAEGIPDWEPKDTIAFGRLLTYQLGETSSDELFFAEASAGTLDAVALDDLFMQRPALDSFTMTASGEQYNWGLRAEPNVSNYAKAIQFARPAAAMAAKVAPTLARLHSILAPFGDPAGSNNWAVGPSRTPNHHALLANDPHLTLFNPSYWYFVELEARTPDATGKVLHVAGASFPGAPGVLIGRSDKLAWGATVVYYDTSDVYLEQLSADLTKVKFHGSDVPMVEKELTFDKIGGAPIKRTFQWVPHHGLVLSVDPTTRTALSVRWTGMAPTQEIKAFLELDHAQSVDEGFKALQDFRVGAQNFVMIDVDGHIAWDPHADVPLRSWAAKYGDAAAGHVPWLPLDGTGTAEWEGSNGGVLEDRNLPSMKDPANRFIVTANQDATGATAQGDPTAFHPLLQDWPAVSYRHARIVELVAGADGNRSDHTMDTMSAIQGDQRSILAATILPTLLVALRDSGVQLNTDADILNQVLKEWTTASGDFQCPTGLDGTDPVNSRPIPDVTTIKQAGACAGFHYLLRELYLAAFGDDLVKVFPGLTAEQALGKVGQERLSRTLTYLVVHPEVFHNGVDGANALWDNRDTLDNETEGQIVAQAMTAAAKKLNQDFGGSSVTWQWGKVHTVSMLGILDSAQTSIFTKAIGPFANNGGQYTIDVGDISPVPGDPFTSESGSSLRIVNDAGDGAIQTRIELPGGETGYRLAPHYQDLVDGWLSNTPVPLSFGGSPAFTPESELTLVPAP